LGKLNPHHDERGQFATADRAVATVGSPARKPQPTAVQVASLDTRSDVAGWMSLRSSNLRLSSRLPLLPRL
jgi:hypothetical protein